MSRKQYDASLSDADENENHSQQPIFQKIILNQPMIISTNENIDAVSQAYHFGRHGNSLYCNVLCDENSVNKGCY